MTGREVCEAYARFCGVPDAQVAVFAERFWASGYRGELWHVGAAQDVMRTTALVAMAWGLFPVDATSRVV